MKVYLSTSWKNKARVRALADALRSAGHEVYDFTDPACRNSPAIPPERFPEEFDPVVHDYGSYISRSEWAAAVNENRRAIEVAGCIVLMLPCGNDSHADWALGVGMGKPSVVVGHPKKGDRSPVHLWADAIFYWDYDVVNWLAGIGGPAA